MGIIQSFKGLFAPRRKSYDIGMLWNLLEGVGTDRLSAFPQRVEEGYRKNGVIFRALMYIADSAASVPWSLYKQVGNERKEQPQNHPILQMLRRPNPRQGGARFMQTFVIHLFLAGKAFIKRGDSTAIREDGKATARMLWLLRPDCVQLKNKAKWEEGWVYKPVGGQPESYAYDDIRPFYMLNPLDEWEGMSPVEVAALTILQANYSREWNRNLLSRGATPGGIISSEYELSKELRDEISEKFEKAFGGFKNAGKPIFLGGNAEWEKTGLGPAEMEWVEGQRMADRMNAVTMGVPPQMMGDRDAATYANVAEARRSFYEEHVIPLLGWVRDELNAWIVVPQYGDDLALDMNLDAVTALQEQQEKKWARVSTADSLTLNEKREALGYDEVKGGDVIVLAGGKAIVLEDGTVFVSSAMKTVEDVIEGEPEPEIPLDPEAMPPPAAESEEDEEEERAVIVPLTKAVNLTPHEKTLAWQDAERRRTYFIGRAKLIVERLLKAEASEVAKAIRFAGYVDGAEQAAVGAIQRSDDAWKEAYRRIYLMTAIEFAKVMHSRMKEAGPDEMKGLLDIWQRSVAAYAVAQVAKKVGRLIDKTITAVKDALRIGVSEGATVDVLARTVENLYREEIIPKRADLVAKTEVVNASNLGAIEAARSIGVVRKEWISSRDERVRSTHVAADGQAVPINEPFLVGGFELPWPGDSSLGAPAQEIQGCRCFVSFLST